MEEGGFGGPVVRVALKDFQVVAVAGVQHDGAAGRLSPGNGGLEAQGLLVELQGTFPVGAANGDVVEAGALDAGVAGGLIRHGWVSPLASGPNDSPAQVHSGVAVIPLDRR